VSDKSAIRPFFGCDFVSIIRASSEKSFAKTRSCHRSNPSATENEFDLVLAPRISILSRLSFVVLRSIAIPSARINFSLNDTCLTDVRGPVLIRSLASLNEVMIRDETEVLGERGLAAPRNDQFQGSRLDMSRVRDLNEKHEVIAVIRSRLRDLESE
jgi:hypothetical protein